MVQNKWLYFDHDYATEVQKKRRECEPLKKVLKMAGIRFQTCIMTWQGGLQHCNPMVLWSSPKTSKVLAWRLRKQQKNYLILLTRLEIQSHKKPPTTWMVSKEGILLALDFGSRIMWLKINILPKLFFFSPLNITHK